MQDGKSKKTPPEVGDGLQRGESQILRMRIAVEALLETPLRVASTTFVLSSLYLLLRFLFAGKHDLGSFIVAGSQYVHRTATTASIPITPGTGYDGQFYYRLALDPFNLAMSHNGITFDTSFRAQRIAYPFFAWILSFGRSGLVPLALVLVNLIAITAIAYFASRFAINQKRSAALGLILAAYPGYLFSIGRDLTEPTAAALLLAAIFAIQVRSYAPASLCLCASVLTRETGGLIVAALFVVWLRDRFRPLPDSTDSRTPFYLWFLPGLSFLFWQIIVRAVEGHTALQSDVAGNLSIPFKAMVSGISDKVVHLNSLGSLIWIIQLAALIAIAYGAMSRLTSFEVPTYLRISMVLMTVLAISLSSEIWKNSSDFRSLDLIWLIGWLVMISSKRSISWRWVLALLPTVITGGQLILFI